MEQTLASNSESERYLRPGPGRSQPLITLDAKSCNSDSSPVTEHSVLLAARILPEQEKSLSAIALRAFVLGFVLAIASTTTTWLLCWQLPVWRPFFFLGALSVFHFLEFYTTARYNTAFANISSFLLTRNGMAYNLAHTAAFLECTITSLAFPHWQNYFNHPVIIALGLTALAIGQIVRSTAMIQAGTNFNHTIQTRKAQNHLLVTHGVYDWLRHPSYFGFFWWALGTQMVLGNLVCLTGYCFVLWRFFDRRIAKEEQLLENFFGNEYTQYKLKTPVLIPFIP